MSHLRKLPYYDLAWEQSHGRISWLTGRIQEQEILTSNTLKPQYNNVAILGAPGVGKTTLARGWAGHLSQQHPEISWIELRADGFEQIQYGPAGALTFIEEAFDTLERAVVYIDDFGSLVYKKPSLCERVVRLLKPLLTRNDVQLIISSDTTSWDWISEQEPQWTNRFEKLLLNEPGHSDLISILEYKTKQLAEKRALEWQEGSLEKIIELCQRYSRFGSGPRSELKLLEEIFSLSVLTKKRIISPTTVENIVHERLGLPTVSKGGNTRHLATQITALLSEKIIGQETAVNIIGNSLKRSLLGLKNPQRPRASFLFLGPSGVGKTETAKVISDLLFSNAHKLLRLDMSEFSEAGTVQRLIGAPPGFIGYEQGGVLTEYGKENPYSVILLDELEKANNKIFDVFLQLLDDGRLTSGSGQLVDFKESILIATSNCAVKEIIEGYRQGKLHDPGTVNELIMPKLVEHFRLEFLNRFDAIIIFNPLSPENLLTISTLEIQKIESRLKQHKVTFAINPELIKREVAGSYDIRFGARPIKRWIEMQCETMLMEQLLKT